MSESLKDIVLALLGAAGLWQLVLWLLNRQANRKKAQAEADKEVAGALAAAVGVNKVGYEAESVAVTNSREIMAQAIQMMKELRQELDEAQEEKKQAVKEKRELQAQIQHLEGEMQQMSRKFGAIEMVVLDIALGVQRLSEQLRERGLEPIWKPTFTVQKLDGVLSDNVRDDVEQLFK